MAKQRINLGRVVGPQGPKGDSYNITALDYSNIAAIAKELILPDLDKKLDLLTSGFNIKTINNMSLLGSGNISIQGGGGESSTKINIYDKNNQYILFISFNALDEDKYIYICLNDFSNLDSSNIIVDCALKDKLPDKCITSISNIDSKTCKIVFDSDFKSLYVQFSIKDTNVKSNKLQVTVTNGTTNAPEVMFLNIENVINGGSNDKYLIGIIYNYTPEEYLDISWKVNGANSTEGKYSANYIYTDASTFVALARLDKQFKSYNTLSLLATHMGKTLEIKIPQEVLIGTSDFKYLNGTTIYTTYYDPNDGFLCRKNITTGEITKFKFSLEERPILYRTPNGLNSIVKLNELPYDI